MYFTRILPAAAMLVTAISATPVHIEHSRRQLGDLTGILKGIMSAGGSSSDSDTSNNGNAGTTTPATTTSADTIALQECSNAISKIEAALSMSASYMKAAGGAPTPQEIQAVLIVLEQSLGADCDDDDNDDDDDITRRDSDQSNDLQQRSEEDGYLEGGCNSDEGVEHDSPDQRMNAQAGTMTLERRDIEADEEDMEKRAAEGTTTSDSDRCSDCERQLYHIVKELQVIFALGAQVSTDLPSLSTSVAAVPTPTLSLPLSEITNLPNLTGTSLSQITEMPQAS